MTTTRSKQQTATPSAPSLGCCMDCKHSHLLQFGKNPVLADCHEQPQPGNERFPYRREVARFLRRCPMYKRTNEVKDIEHRTAA